PPWPYGRMTIYRLMQWSNNGRLMKSDQQIDTLVKEVICQPDFDKNDLLGFSVRRAKKQLDDALEAHSASQKFKSTSISISIPSGDRKIAAAPFTVPGFLSQNLSSLIKQAFSSSNKLSPFLHLTPYKLFHNLPHHSYAERVHGEVYTSKVFLDEYDNVRHHSPVPPLDPHCRREKTVAALMFSSDATQLTNFGDSQAWPIYTMFGNHSKYLRGQPETGAIHHLAYIPKLPDSLNDFGACQHTKWHTHKEKLWTHCKRELVHEVWKQILDEEFLHYYKYGMVVRCSDGVERRVYPRILIYSADYPEKVILLTMRDKGLCPCPRCLIQTKDLDGLGLVKDIKIRSTRTRIFSKDDVVLARKMIYEQGYSIKGEAVNNILKDRSDVPVLNAFFEKLNPITSFTPSSMAVVDIMHEFELGVWKTLFIHLMRLLRAVGPGETQTNELNFRYRLVPTFGNGTIRVFPQNASDMKRRAARDYEDLLQCAIPVFQGLLPSDEDDRLLLKLLYKVAEWHALAKLRMHTETSLSSLQKVTSELGQLIRKFRNQTASYNAKELPAEVEARKKKKSATSVDDGTKRKAAASGGDDKPKIKTLNLLTPKFHSLGDYVQQIETFGTTDSYSTQLGEMTHKFLKRTYQRTNKKGAMKQIASQYIRGAALDSSQPSSENPNQADEDTLPELYPGSHHHIPHLQKRSVNIAAFIMENQHDPALKEHLLGRLLEKLWDGDTYPGFTHEDLQTLEILKNTLYLQQTMVVHYTSYDIQAKYDTVRVGSHSDIMLQPSHGDSSLFLYARVLGIYSVDVRHTGPLSKDETKVHQMQFLWVRWFGIQPGYTSRGKNMKLPMIGFLPITDPYPFGFLDPIYVIRTTHLIPAFAYGKTKALLPGSSIARNSGEDQDWENYYVNIFVDRDMYMRYTGGGVGHLGLSYLDKMDVDEPTIAEETNGKEKEQIEDYPMGDAEENLDEVTKGDKQMDTEKGGEDKDVDVDEEEGEDTDEFENNDGDDDDDDDDG
ncbi:hypothetical protein BDN72DRAFT_742067, partial [Pluteus cervinus]